VPAFHRQWLRVPQCRSEDDLRSVVASTIVWSRKFKSFDEGIQSLQEWAKENDWHAIVGTRFVQVTDLYKAGGGSGYVTPASVDLLDGH
jgi:hypothetical protein